MNLFCKLCKTYLSAILGVPTTTLHERELKADRTITEASFFVYSRYQATKNPLEPRQQLFKLLYSNASLDSKTLSSNIGTLKQSSQYS